MANGAGGTPAGRAYVEVGTWTQPFETGLAGVERRLKRFGAFVTRLGQTLFSAGAGMGLGLVFAIKAAGNAQESMARFRQVFGPLTQQAEAFGNALATATQRGKVGTKDAMSNFQSFFVGLGWAKDKALEMSKQMVSLGIDFASFVNIEDADALHRFISALSGSVNVLDQFGLDLHEAAINSEFLRMGLKVTTATATEQQKVLARMAIIQRGMGQQGAIGQAVREAGSFMGQWRRLKAAVEDASVAIGDALLPTMTTIVTWFGNVSQGITRFVEANRGLVVVLAGTVVAITAAGIALIGLGLGIGALGTIIGAIGAVLSTIVTLVGALLTPVGLVVAGFVALGAAIITYTGAGQAALAAMGAQFTQLWSTATAAFQGIANALGQGNIALAGNILMTSLKIAFQTGWDALKGTAVTALTYIEGAIDQAGVGIVVAWTTAVTSIEGAFDTLATNLRTIWNSVIASIVGGVDRFMVASVVAIKEVWFKWRESKIAMQPLMSSEAKQRAYAGINSEREQYRAGAEKVSQRGQEWQDKVTAENAAQNAGLEQRRKDRQQRIEFAAGGDQAAERAAERQARIDDLSKPSDELAGLQAELNKLLAQAAVKPKALEGDRQTLAIGAIDGATAAAAKVDTKHPEAAAFGSKDAASTIARSAALGKHDLEQQQLVAINQLKTSMDKAAGFLKDILKAATGIEIKELKA